jgi:hypothetical protein
MQVAYLTLDEINENVAPAIADEKKAELKSEASERAQVISLLKKYAD